MSDILEDITKNGTVVPREVSEMLVKISKLRVADVFMDAEVRLIIKAFAALVTDKVMKAGSPMRKRGEVKKGGGGHTREKVGITTNATVRAFADILVGTERMPVKADKEAVLLIVSEYYSIAGVTLLGSHQGREISQARHIIAYLCREGVGMKTGKIAAFLHMNHCYVSTIFKKLKEKFLTNTKLKNEAEGLLQLVKSLPKE